MRRSAGNAAANYHFKGVVGMIPTAGVQRGLSEAARCASTGIVPGHHAHFSASSQRHERGRGSFRQIDHEFVSGVGQQRIPETVL